MTEPWAAPTGHGAIDPREAKALAKARRVASIKVGGIAAIALVVISGILGANSGTNVVLFIVAWPAFALLFQGLKWPALKKCGWLRPHLPYWDHDDDPAKAPAATRRFIKAIAFSDVVKSSMSGGVLAGIATCVSLIAGFKVPADKAIVWAIIVAVASAVALLRLRWDRIKRAMPVASAYFVCEYSGCNAKIVWIGQTLIDYDWLGIAPPSSRRRAPPPNALKMIVESNGRIHYELRPAPPPPRHLSGMTY